jgi:hypothetical protein
MTYWFGEIHSSAAWYYDWVDPYHPASRTWVNAPAFKRFITADNQPDSEYARGKLLFSGRHPFENFFSQGGIAAIKVGDDIAIDVDETDGYIRPTHNMLVTKIDLNRAGGVDLFVTYHGINRKDRSLKGIIRNHQVTDHALPFMWVIHMYDRGQNAPTVPQMP